MSACRARPFFLFFISILLVSCFSFHCGGGFKQDSPNAVQFRDVIFGNDSIAQPIP